MPALPAPAPPLTAARPALPALPVLPAVALGAVTPAAPVALLPDVPANAGLAPAAGVVTMLGAAPAPALGAGVPALVVCVGLVIGNVVATGASLLQAAQLNVNIAPQAARASTGLRATAHATDMKTPWYESTRASAVRRLASQHA
jgi:hypothetical protein